MKETVTNHIIIEAVTVQQAIEIAADHLNVSKDRIKIELLREEKRGLFGMSGERLARVRASIISTVQQPV